MVERVDVTGGPRDQPGAELEQVWNAVLQVLSEQRRHFALLDSSERDAWVALSERLVPNCSPDALAAARGIVGDKFPAHELGKAQADLRGALEYTLQQLSAHELSPEALSRLEHERTAAQAALDDCARRLAAARGAHREELQVLRESLEADAHRFASAIAAHHRARNRAEGVRRELALSNEASLRRARHAAVDALFNLAPADIARIAAVDPVSGELLVQVSALRAKRQVIHEALNETVRAPASQIAELRRATEAFDAFQLASLPPRVRLLSDALQRGIEKFRAICARVLAFSEYPPRPPEHGWRALFFAEPATSEAPLHATGLIDADIAAGERSDGEIDVFSEKTIEQVREAFDDHVPALTSRLSRPALGTTQRARVETAFRPGHELGRYRIKGLIGRGGMAEVYLATQHGAEGFTRQVVVKRMSNRFDDDDLALRMFMHEARIAASLSHPNIVQIFDLQRIDGELLIVMEYLEGAPVNRVALERGGKPVIAWVNRILLDASRALAFAHRQLDEDGNLLRLVHRDISPDNLFLTRTGCTKLLDFGIARRDDLTLMTEEGSLKGKIAFMAPEQIRGEELDGRADLFALGVTAYWMLTGKRPFRGTNEAATLNAVLAHTPEPLHALRSDLPPELSALVHAMLEKDRRARPQDAGEVVAQLQRLAPATWEELATATGLA